MGLVWEGYNGNVGRGYRSNRIDREDQVPALAVSNASSHVHRFRLHDDLRTVLVCMPSALVQQELATTKINSLALCAHKSPSSRVFVCAAIPMTSLHCAFWLQITCRNTFLCSLSLMLLLCLQGAAAAIPS